MNRMRSIILVAALLGLAGGCTKKDPVYGVERQLFLPGERTQVWAVAPAINLSGMSAVDELLQADLLYQQLQTVHGIKAIPVNRVVEVYVALGIEHVQDQQQAGVVCDLLAADGLIVPTITAFDPYNPPKLGASLQLFRRQWADRTSENIDPRELTRMATLPQAQARPREAELIQTVGMYDAASGSVREKLAGYADGRNDPVGPLGAREYLLSMDRYCGFVYHDLVERLLLKLQ